MGDARSLNFFNAEDGQIMGRKPIWVQGMLTTLVQMFEWVGMYAILGKSKTMTCTLRFIWGQLGKGEYKQRVRDEGTTF